MSVWVTKRYGQPIRYEDREAFVQGCLDHWSDAYAGELEDMASRISTMEKLLAKLLAKGDMDIQVLAEILDVDHWHIEEQDD